MSSVPRAAQILLVGQKIRQIRKSRHLTQADLAAKIGVTQSDLSRMENGEYKVGLATLLKILQVFELSMSHFFEEPADEAPALAPAPTGDQHTLLHDWALLSEDSRLEVLEFVAFKKSQADSRRRRSETERRDDTVSGPWRPEAPEPEE